ncbi:hypothetical protein [Chryseobacterium luquanense]|uniref:Translation elongation factor EFTu/EF1A C-terminal domain-containing protein n=1 Tax=Chryseobacterium luquanense TaxID=2983766 RepID=A0ABT3Y723_9FLAO|nr:hypothetical protein [Chryseobacterium luquanense]MCX8533950.1 hypothetical protein [Chryseobacterium luquanense]
MKKTSHFTALINFYPTDNNGLVSPVSTGFRVLFQFPYGLQSYLGALNFEEEELVFPGDSVSINVTLIDAELFINQLYSGMDFEIKDQSGVIGNGIVTETFI